jgi:pimeloyl-ACP methyl ester carboxylesterase
MTILPSKNILLTNKAMITALLLIVLLLVSCSVSNKMKKSYDQRPVPTRPDYAKQENWAALPDKKDWADTVPISSLSDNQDTAIADVFFIHPTTYFKRDFWNAPVDAPELNAKTDKSAILHQASVFNGSYRIYAPRYRQMALDGFFTKDLISKKRAIDTAFADVERAFLYYLDHYNKGRPLIIAGHSQGGLMTVLLLKKYFDQKELYRQLIIAMPIGWSVKQDEFHQIPVCRDSSQTGCFVSWNTYSWKYKLRNNYAAFYNGAVVVNPLNWKSDSTYANYTANKGVLNVKYNKLIPAWVDAKAGNGVLRIHKKKLPLRAAFIHRFHIADYNLFWMNIRENMDLRLKFFLLNH